MFLQPLSPTLSRRAKVVERWSQAVEPKVVGSWSSATAPRGQGGSGVMDRWTDGSMELETAESRLDAGINHCGDMAWPAPGAW